MKTERNSNEELHRTFFPTQAARANSNGAAFACFTARDYNKSFNGGEFCESLIGFSVFYRRQPE